MFEHIGGGCMVGPNDDPECRQFPCDDQYVNKETGENITFRSNMNTHFKMPSSFTNKNEVLKLNARNVENVWLEKSWFDKIPL